ncbi:type VI secretion system membrane subunit TssM [Ningiella sp. W23]|uniref:type VI secretion system membrane subunit TssM n=1 Tax=Ningiella sp. W23 TaxID=3023715 RepID=UPI0037578623
MSKETLLALVKHRYFLPTLYLLLIVLGIFLAGPYLAFAGYVPLSSVVSRVLLSTIIVVSYTLYRYITYLKTLSKQSSFVNELSETDDVAEAVSAESKALKSKFVGAFDALKRTKGSASSLLELPWYMIIGSPGSGKTTLLSNSGLQFPLADKLNAKHLDGIGGTKNCDWWISNEAVLLDTAGRYTSQDSFQEVDKTGWQNFLGLIKRYRRKPISGLLVSISMADVLSMNEYELQKHVTTLKQRIGEVNTFFNTQFPVYVLITKSDMLAGFTQFYDSFSHKEREQAFGLALDENKAGIDTRELSVEFNDKFAELLKSLSRRQWNRMAMERDSNRKALIYSFRDQIASLQQTLSDIIQNLSLAEAGIDGNIRPGLVRGLYFTSGTQSGAPIDRMLTRISKAFGLRHAHPVSWNNDQRSYFIKDLLQQLVFKEADKFGTLAMYERKKRRVKQLALAMFSLATVALCSSFYISFKNNEAFLNEGKTVVDRWITQHQSQGVQQDLRQNIPALNDFANDLQRLSAEHSQHFSGLGLNQQRTLANALDASYQRLLASILLPFVKQEMELQMRSHSDPVLQYQALKSYLMMAQPERRDNEYLIEYLLSSMNNNAYFSEQEYAQIQTHLSALIAGNVMISQSNQSSIDAARQSLNAQALDDVYYQQLRRTYLTNTENFQSLAQLAGSNWRNAFTTSLDEVFSISTLFTPSVFKQLTGNEIANYVEQLAKETWVLGPNKRIDPEALQTQLELLYASEYVQQWRALINSVSIKQNTDLASLLTSLPELSKSTSPIFNLLESISRATNLTGLNLSAAGSTELGQQVQQSIQVAQSKFNSDGSEFFISSRFSALHELMNSERRQSAEQRLSALLQELNVSLSLQAQNMQSVSPPQSLQALKGFGLLQVAPLSRWIEELSSSVENVQSQIRKTQLSNLWKRQVFAQCQAISSTKYPFAKSAPVDASLNDLNQMFGNNGIILSFFNTHLSALANTQTRPWTWKDGVQAKYQFSPSVLPFFENSAMVQQALFTKNPAAASMQLALTPVFLDSKLSQIKMDIYGTQLSYQFGRPIAVNVSWPPANPQRSSDIVFVRRDGSEVVMSERGIYSLVKLIDAAKTERESQTQVQVTFSKDGYSSIYRISGNDGSDPLVLNRLGDFNCLQAL